MSRDLHRLRGEEQRRLDTADRQADEPQGGLLKLLVASAAVSCCVALRVLIVDFEVYRLVIQSNVLIETTVSSLVSKAIKF